jgi:osmotically-inducible protein OsmY
MRKPCLVLALGLLLAGCSQQDRRVDLNVDLFLHPQAASADDLLLLAAVRKRLIESRPSDAGLLHVRVAQGVVFLSGTASTEQARAEIEKTALSTEVAVNGSSLRPQRVRNDLALAP